jgi:inositol phosphorylceramide mannosyltransferase catalytic subunit
MNPWIVFIICIFLVLLMVYNNHTYKKEKIEKAKLDINNIAKNLENFNLDYTQPSRKITYPVYYINMDKDVERKKETIFQLSKISDDFKRVSGVNGRKIKNIQSDTVDGVSFINEYDMTEPEIGCLLSHIKAINTAYDNNNEIALICEDDIYTEPYAIPEPYAISKSLEKIVESAPEDWEWLQLYSGGISEKDLKIIKTDEILYVPYSHKNWSCVAYLINRRGMKKLLDILGKPYNIRYLNKSRNFPEYGMADLWIPDVLNSYVVLPFPFSSHPRGNSTIHNDHVDSIHMPALHIYLTDINRRLKQRLKSCIFKELSNHEIPKIIHMIWISKDTPFVDVNVPDKYSKYITTWKDANPDWEFMFWSGETILKLIQDNLPEFLHFYTNIEKVISKCDFARFAVMYVYGGLYTDVDVYCRKSINSLLKGHDSYFVMEPHSQQQDMKKIINGFFASYKNSDFVYGFLECMKEKCEGMQGEKKNDTYTDVMKTTGPGALYDYALKTDNTFYLGDTCSFMFITIDGSISEECKGVYNNYGCTLWVDGSNWVNGESEEGNDKSIFTYIKNPIDNSEMIWEKNRQLNWKGLSPTLREDTLLKPVNGVIRMQNTNADKIIPLACVLKNSGEDTMIEVSETPNEECDFIEKMCLVNSLGNVVIK